MDSVDKIDFAEPYLEIDLKAVKSNFLKLSNLSYPSEVCAVVKADAYGCGMEKISKTLFYNGCKNFFVAKIQEGIELRNYISRKCKIFVFDGLTNHDMNIWDRNNLIPVCNSIKQVKLAVKSNIYCSIHIDTGMNRLGIPTDDIKKISEIKSLKNFKKYVMILSHFSCSEDKNSINNAKQINKFKSFNHILKNIPRSLSNSHGIINFKEAKFQFTRPGLALYGYLEFKQKILKPSLSLYAPVLQIKKVKINEEIGYGGSFKVKRESIVCILGIGYADGLKRILGNKANLLYKNYKVPIIGRMSMDTTILDITDLPNNLVTKLKFFPIINKRFGINELAEECNTIPYEIMTSFGKRVKRIYKN